MEEYWAFEGCRVSWRSVESWRDVGRLYELWEDCMSCGKIV